MTLLDTPSIIGIIVSIALIATTIAVCLYLYSLRNKASNEEDKTEEKSDAQE